MKPQVIEFWQGRASACMTAWSAGGMGKGWTVERLQP